MNTANPLARLVQGSISALDFAVLAHSFAAHGRDYNIVLQDSVGPAPGTYKLTLTHVVHMDYETRVRDDVWPASWQDVFLNHAGWEAADAPNGYVWGTNWSLAYPGINSLEPTSATIEWSGRLGRTMHHMALETDRFRLTAIFHDVHLERLSDDTELVAKVLNPL